MLPPTSDFETRYGYDTNGTFQTRYGFETQATNPSMLTQPPHSLPPESGYSAGGGCRTRFADETQVTANDPVGRTRPASRLFQTQPVHASDGPFQTRYSDETQLTRAPSGSYPTQSGYGADGTFQTRYGDVADVPNNPSRRDSRGPFQTQYGYNASGAFDTRYDDQNAFPTRYGDNAGSSHQLPRDDQQPGQPKDTSQPSSHKAAEAGASSSWLGGGGLFSSWLKPSSAVADQPRQGEGSDSQGQGASRRNEGGEVNPLGKSPKPSDVDAGDGHDGHNAEVFGRKAGFFGLGNAGGLHHAADSEFRPATNAPGIGRPSAGDVTFEKFAEGPSGDLGAGGVGNASTFVGEKGRYGPEGIRLTPEERPQDPPAKIQETIEQAVEEAVEMDWFMSEANRFEQEQLAMTHLRAIQGAVDERHKAGVCWDMRWTNDPEIFPELGLTGTATSTGVVPFPPHDQQFYVCGRYDDELSKLRGSAIPSCMLDVDGNSTWCRLVDFAPRADACQVFDESLPQGKAPFGRVFQGSLDNGYFIEALQAISLRPRLARQLLYCWDVRRSIYIARIFKHGTWVRVEIDDYVPIGPPNLDDLPPSVPICCRSEHFPFVLWPSLVEKAYAKVHTIRGQTSDVSPADRGGWEAIGDGGRTEEALSDLTGGVAGRFRTGDVDADRLFIYLHELQRDTLFVCRVHESNCDMHGVRLNPYYPNVVNRAVVWEGKMFVQMFCGAPCICDGGLQDVGVPWSLINSKLFPERTCDGFFWITAHDLQVYYDTIFECRLVNSGDVSIDGMPPPRLPGVLGTLSPSPRAIPGDQRLAGLPSGPWTEWVYANPGVITKRNLPEFTIRVPEHQCPCEILCSVEQTDPRLVQTSPTRTAPLQVIVTVHENIMGTPYFSKDPICKSNWIAVRDSMVAFCARHGGEYKVMVDIPGKDSSIDRMIFRAYASTPHISVTVGARTSSEMMQMPREPPRALRWSFVGCMRASGHYAEGEARKSVVTVVRDLFNLPLGLPEPLDLEHDSMRKAEHDLNPLYGELKECVLM
eukprot:TRINITY_DN61995_c0_g1_i1.p1 TRINITY_DN61995_c0_g1~~TRINITY_DN61995_c0_g1_i1.p1  ORF type:complete len:1034 (+),score=98.09 TRINITY_DN61995_c0_g1_i1:89-3190(+)